MDLNRRHSEEFVRDRPLRQDWRGHNPEVGWIGCMDGRTNPSLITDTPLGLWPLWQNIGGRFDLEEWPRFQESVLGLWRHAKQKGRKLIWAIADHYSTGDNPRLGCRGHNYDIGEAQRASQALKRQFDRFFGKDADVCAVHVSIDTDCNRIVFHGPARDVNIPESEFASEGAVQGNFVSAYPRAPEWAIAHLVKIAMRNLKHVSRVRAARVSIEETEHGEWVAALGRGLDCWLHVRNTALTICPFDPNFNRVVREAGRIIHGNARRADFNRNRGVVLLAAAPYRQADGDVGRAFAAHRALKLLEQGARAMENIPQLGEIEHLAAIVNMADQRAEIVQG
jgi:hypothetical protein